MGWFEKKVEITVTDEDGKPKTVEVSKKQFDQWVAEGKIRHVDACTVHIFDPMGDRIEHWEIGKHIAREVYDKFKDSSGNLYAMVTYTAGQPNMRIVTKQMWDQLKDQLKSAGL